MCEIVRSFVVFFTLGCAFFTPWGAKATNHARDLSGREADLMGVWGASSAAVFTVGNSGTILFYDGSGWTRMETGTTSDLRAVWGSSPTNVYAVGASGTILRYDGNAWRRMPARTDQDLTGVWGSSPEDIYATGARGTVLHCDGSDWKSLGTGFTERRGFMRAAAASLGSVFGGSKESVFVVGGYESSEVESGRSSYYGVAARFDGARWEEIEVMLCPIPCEFRGVWCASDKEVFAVGDFSRIIHYDGAQWIEMDLEDKSVELNGVWGSSGEDVFAVGRHGTILHYDGAKWTRTGHGERSLSAVWGSSGSDVFAVGAGGTILHFDGSAWKPMNG